MKTKDKLANRLFKANEKVAESKAVLKYVATNDTRVLCCPPWSQRVSPSLGGANERLTSESQKTSGTRVSVVLFQYNVS